MSASAEGLSREDPAPELVERAGAAGWPADLIGRMLAIRLPIGLIYGWLEAPPSAVDGIQDYVGMLERLNLGTLRARSLNSDDGPAVAELFAQSPERIGDFDVTVERSPNALAQFELMENVVIWALEDRRLLLAAIAVGIRHCLVNGARLSVRFPVGLRTRLDQRGQGLSRLLTGSGARPVGGPRQAAQAAYVRADNAGVHGWIDALWGTTSTRPSYETASGQVLGLPVSVLHLRAQPSDVSTAGIRAARDGDLHRCVSLINRTHRRLDLFRTYSEEYLRMKLDEQSWRVQPQARSRVYGWGDVYVLEEDDVVVACAGLWDRGRDVREVWTERETGRTRTVEVTNVLDLGFARGREDAMQRLLRHLCGLSADLGRQHLVAPLEHLPAVTDGLADLDPVVETRGLLWTMWQQDGSNDPNPPFSPKRAYTDLAYW